MQSSQGPEPPAAQDEDGGSEPVTVTYHPWDLAVALRDLSFDMAKHIDSKTQPSLAEVTRWHESVYNAAPVYWALESACEDLVEDGVTEARVRAIKQALTHAQGQAKYWQRKDRW